MPRNIQKKFVSCAAIVALSICRQAFPDGLEQPEYSNKINNNGKYYVSVFDCMIDLPAGYVLNTKEHEYFSFVKKTDGYGRISIDKYDNSIEMSDELEITKQKKVDGLTVVFIKANWYPSEVVVIHDNKYGVRIIGDDVFLWEDMIRTCIDTKE